MTQRTDSLSRELQAIFLEWGYGDEGLTLTRATKEDHATVAALAETMPLDDLVREIAVVVADVVGTAIQQKGLRPADYSKDKPVAEMLAGRIAKALPSDTFATAFQAYLRGRG